MKNYMNNNYFGQKGQAMVELATFGAILLFCLTMLVNFGLQANYQQDTEMRAFRQAMERSYNSTRGPSAGAETNLIEDRPGISTQDAYGVSERYSFAAGSKATWNNDLMDEHVDASDTPRPEYLPVATYDINEKNYTYTTAAFKEYSCPASGRIVVRVARLERKNGKFWEDVMVDCETQTKIFQEKDPDDKPFLTGYVKIDGEKEQIGSADVDGDGKQELVVAVKGAEKGPIQTYVVMDSQEGDIDTTVDIKHKPDGSSDLEAYAKMRQGLLPNYVREIHKKVQFKKQETETSFVTTSTAPAAENYETITRSMKLNKFIGPPIQIKDELSNGRNIEWTSPK